MNLLIFTIRDRKAESFNTPFFFTTQGQALRAFQDLANDKNSTVGQHPDDFALYLVGAFNTDDATFTATDSIAQKLLALATDLVDTTAVPLQRIG